MSIHNCLQTVETGPSYRYNPRMDLSNVDMTQLAKQLRKPEGEWGKQVGAMMAEHTEPLNMFAIKCLNIQPADRILEIGFGPGVAIEEIAHLAPDGYIAGIDHSPEMLAMAEQRNRKPIIEERVELIIGTADELPYDDASFDKVFAVNVFHFWPDPTAELKECQRVLKPGGMILFYLTEPAFWPKGLAESGVFIARTPAEVQEILKQAGFNKTEYRLHSAKDFKGFAVWGIK